MRMSESDKSKRKTPTRWLGVVTALLVCGACGGDAPEREIAEELEGPQEPYADQTAYGFDDMDNDGDSELDENEFHEWLEGPQFAYYYQRLVVEEPTAPEDVGALDAEVLIDGLYQAWDRNRDGALDRDEWDAAARLLETLSDTTASWIEFDTDGNEIVELAEVNAVIEEEPALAAMDMNDDGDITDEEFNRWFFEVFDIDGNGAVDRDEWRLAELYLDVPVL